MFSVDYSTLRQIIAQFSYTGVFRAEVRASSRSGRGQVELLVKDGKVLICRFTPVQGQMQTWDDWEVRLPALGVLDWNHIQDGLPGASSSAPLKRTSLKQRQSAEDSMLQQYKVIPYRNFTVEPAQLNQWPTAYRSVYLLIDGRRSASDIAVLLSKGLEDIIPLLEELLKRDIIKMY